MKPAMRRCQKSADSGQNAAILAPSLHRASSLTYDSLRNLLPNIVLRRHNEVRIATRPGRNALRFYLRCDSCDYQRFGVLVIQKVR